MKVAIARRARADLKEAALWWAEHRSSEQALRWYRESLKQIRSLSRNAKRHPIAEESASFPYEIRQLSYGVGRKRTHRVVFAIRPTWCLFFACGTSRKSPCPLTTPSELGSRGGGPNHGSWGWPPVDFGSRFC
jgi:plasmid stabilization system protein ParE